MPPFRGCEFIDRIASALPWAGSLQPLQVSRCLLGLLGWPTAGRSERHLIGLSRQTARSSWEYRYLAPTTQPAQTDKIALILPPRCVYKTDMLPILLSKGGPMIYLILGASAVALGVFI